MRPSRALRASQLATARPLDASSWATSEARSGGRGGGWARTVGERDAAKASRHAFESGSREVGTQLAPSRLPLLPPSPRRALLSPILPVFSRMPADGEMHPPATAPGRRRPARPRGAGMNAPPPASAHGREQARAEASCTPARVTHSPHPRRRVRAVPDSRSDQGSFTARAMVIDCPHRASAPRRAGIPRPLLSLFVADERIDGSTFHPWRRRLDGHGTAGHTSTEATSDDRPRAACPTSQCVRILPSRATHPSRCLQGSSQADMHMTPRGRRRSSSIAPCRDS